MRAQSRRPNQRGRYPRKEGPTSHPTNTPKKHLDVNCNLGQGFGIHQNIFEEEVVPYVTSVNIACGGHAGDPLTIAKTIETIRSHNVSVGALIGYPDLIGNGQREMYLGIDELRAMVLYQLGALHALAHAKGFEIRHVRTHGFLYKQLYSDLLIAETVAKAVAEFSSWITLVGLSSQVLSTACTNANIKAGHEVQINRRYRRDGSILPFNASIDGKNFIEQSARRARELVQTGRITCEDKSRVPINVDTLHIPSDLQQSAELARTIRALIPDPKPLHLDKYDKYIADVDNLN